MERLCFTKKECKQLIENELFGIFNDQEHSTNLTELIQRSKIYFDSEIIIFNYFISKLLEQYLKQDESKCFKIIEYLGEVHGKMYITLEEFNSDFINNLMTRSMPTTDSTLEEDLLEIRNSYYG